MLSSEWEHCSDTLVKSLYHHAFQNWKHCILKLCFLVFTFHFPSISISNSILIKCQSLLFQASLLPRSSMGRDTLSRCVQDGEGRSFVHSLIACSLPFCLYTVTNFSSKFSIVSRGTDLKSTPTALEILFTKEVRVTGLLSVPKSWVSILIMKC